MIQDIETINEHIRNGLSPIVCLIDLVENLGVEYNKELLSDLIKTSRKSIDKLLRLGYNIYEDENVWKEENNEEV